MTVQNSIDALQDYIDGTQGTDPDELRLRLERTIAEHPLDPQSALTFGMAYYHLGDLQHAEDCLRLSPSSRARLWLGFTLYDAGDYAEADDHFAHSLDHLSLQNWCFVKVLELRCCCRMRASPHLLSAGDFDTLVQSRMNLPEEDRPVPKELAESLSAVADRLGPGVLRHALDHFEAEFRDWGLCPPSMPS